MKMKAIADKNAEKKIIKKGKFIQLMKKGDWEYIERNNCSGAVVILALTKDKKIIFVEQYRPPVGKNVIEFPAGLIGDNVNCKINNRKESILQAAKRELLEETGYKAEKIKIIHCGPAASGVSSEMLTLVRAFNIKKVSSGGGDEMEAIKVHEVPLNYAERWFKTMSKKGCLIGSRLYAGLYFLNKYNKKIKIN